VQIFSVWSAAKKFSFSVVVFFEKHPDKLAIKKRTLVIALDFIGWGIIVPP
jgi:hypothetical protein